MNVLQGGSLIQDVPSEMHTKSSMHGPAMKAPSRTTTSRSKPVRSWRNSPAGTKRESTARITRPCLNRARIFASSPARPMA